MFIVGQKVVCVNDVPKTPYSKAIMPKKGEVYTIRWIGQRPTDGGPVVLLVEHHGGIHPTVGVEWGFNPRRFRPIVETKTDISVFTAMLKTKKSKINA